MCGIAGIINRKGFAADERRVKQMTDAMAHRGPDAEAVLSVDCMAFGHRRLSIIDVSDASNQPFTDNSGRYVMVFNGEIYNFASIKPLLKNYEFKTSGDTELVIAAYAAWGPDCLTRFRGMFSLVIWDRLEKKVFAARDPMGVKPFYYYVDNEYLIFASEQRAILASGSVKGEVDPQALVDYFSFQSMATPFSTLKNIRQLPAGSWMMLDKGEIKIESYWNVAHYAGQSMDDSSATKKKIKNLLLQSIERRLVSDVPVGAFLSGGIDSSAVVALMAEAGSAAPNTFTLAFNEREYDESSFANIIAKKYRTNHNQVLVSPHIFLDELPCALDSMDMPSGDGINTYVVSKAIRRAGMTVALSGAGGDELFAGYPFFNQYLNIQQKSWLWSLPKALRALMALPLQKGKWSRIGQLLKKDTPFIADVYPVFRQISSPDWLSSHTRLPVQNGTAVEASLQAEAKAVASFPLLSQVSIAEYKGYTQHTLLKDTDQMGMAVSLEIREPYFDQDLVEYVLSIPDIIKKPTYPKSLLVESLSPMLPDDIVFRKKQGFVFPWALWMKNELRSFCDTHIKQMEERTFIRPGELTRNWNNFLKGDAHVRWAELWLFVVLDYWMQKNNVN